MRMGNSEYKVTWLPAIIAMPKLPKITIWQKICALLSVLWLARIVVLALNAFPAIASSANLTFDDMRSDNFVLYGVPAAATDEEIAAVYARIQADLEDDRVAGRTSASVRRFSGTSGVDIAAHAANHDWLDKQLAGIRKRALHNAVLIDVLTWLAAWAIPVLMLFSLGWVLTRRTRIPDARYMHE